MNSSGEFILMGDIEAAIQDILLNRTPELAPYDVVKISTDYRGYNLGMRWIMVSREGGVRVWPRLDHPRIDVWSLAERRDVASDMAQVARASIFRAAGRYSGMGLTITAVKEEVGPVRVADKPTSSDQYLFSLSLTTVPFAGAYS